MGGNGEESTGEKGASSTAGSREGLGQTVESTEDGMIWSRVGDLINSSVSFEAVYVAATKRRNINVVARTYHQ